MNMQYCHFLIELLRREVDIVIAGLMPARSHWTRVVWSILQTNALFLNILRWSWTRENTERKTIKFVIRGHTRQYRPLRTKTRRRQPQCGRNARAATRRRRAQDKGMAPRCDGRVEPQQKPDKLRCTRAWESLSSHTGHFPLCCVCVPYE